MSDPDEREAVTGIGLDVVMFDGVTPDDIAAVLGVEYNPTPGVC